MPNKAEHYLHYKKNSVFHHFFMKVVVVKDGLTLKEMVQGSLGIR